MKEIADRIREVRISRGMTQQDLADALGLKSKTSVNKIEQNQYEISLDRAKQIAEVLNVDPAYIVFGDDSREKMKSEINRLFDRLSKDQQESVLQFLRSMTEGRK